MIPTIVLLLSTILPALTQEDHQIITSLRYIKRRVKPTIVFGHFVEYGDLPFLVSIKRTLQKGNKKKLWSNYCGGSIIKHMKVLTAAHCFELQDYYYYYHTNEMRVVAGSLLNNLYHSGNTTTTTEHQWRKLANVKLHYDFHFPLNDIALVFVDAPFVYTETVNCITPARKMTDYAGKCIAAGFGEIFHGAVDSYPQELRRAEINLMSRSQCQAIWETAMDDFICSYSVMTDVSAGDSGGPLVCFNTLDPAAKSGSPLLVGVIGGKNFDKTTLFTRVAKYRDWIDSNRASAPELRIGFLCLWVKYVCMCFGWFYFLKCCSD